MFEFAFIKAERKRHQELRKIEAAYDEYVL